MHRGDLEIVDTNLASLTEWENVTQITGSLVISANLALKDLIGLQHLTTIEGRLEHQWQHRIDEPEGSPEP